MNRIALLALAACLTAFPATAEQEFAADAGFWQGVGIQAGGENWPFEVKLGDGASLIDYPSLGCSGEWKVLRQTEKLLVAIEDITNGDDICVTGGIVRLEILAEDMLAYTWLDASGEAAALAVLIPGKIDPALHDELLQLTRDTMQTGALEQPSAIGGIKEATDL